MRPSNSAWRVGACLALVACAAFAFAEPAWAGSAPAAASLKVAAPLAVRVKAAFTMHGTASTAVSAGETLTVSMERLGRDWSVVTTSAITVGTKHQFSAKLSAPQRGHWRIVVGLPPSTAHVAATSTVTFKVVGAKVIALTFDDGPWPTSTAGIVSALSKGYVEATFFELGSQIGGRAALSRLVLANDNVIGIHSWNHALMTSRSASVNSADLKRCQSALFKATSYKARWFRPPYGATNATLKKTAKSLGLGQVLWTVDTLDWKYRVKSSIVSRALAGAKDGGVILMHDGGGPRGATVSAVPVIIAKLRAKGFDFVTLDQLDALGYRVP